MTPEIEQELVNAYPALFADRESKGSCMAYGCECGDGWAEILRSLGRLIAGRKCGYRFSQIKEKFGLLRIYGYGGDDYIAGAVAMAEAVSGSVCERCGDRGSVRGKGWLVTLCDRCHEKSQGGK